LKIKMAVFWVAAPHSPAEVYQHFEVPAASIIRVMSKPHAKSQYETQEQKQNLDYISGE
jgi:hypothetical protein